MHTKGPWNAPGYTIWRGYANKPNYPIHAKKRGKIAEANRIDDAILIAAAPELLEVLQMVRDYVVTMKGQGHDYQIAIDAVIAKATKGD